MSDMKALIKENVLLALTGIVAGAANGFFGGGGGMLVVPALTLLLHRKAKKAHATALLIILPITVVSGIVYAFYGTFDFKVGIPACIGVVVGGAVGALLLKKLKNSVITAVFSFIMAAAGVKLLFF